ncbi:MAG: hypothetical protein HRT53_17095 [Colwellia sp.]|nr:hypothetical protein [Colwellia sp.]
MKQLHLLITLVLILILTGCANYSNREAISKEIRVVAVNDFRNEITAETPLNWYGDFKIIMENPRPDTAEFTLFIKQKIEQEIIKKGFNFKIDGAGSKYQVIAFALVGKKEATRDYLDIFKLFPELAQNTDFEQGTLIIAIIDPIAKKSAWRASVKLYIDPNLVKELRKIRISATITKVLKTLRLPNST